MKRSFFTGLALFLPFGLTVWIVVKLFNLFTLPFLGIGEKLLNALQLHYHLSIWQHEILARGFARLISLIVLIALIFLTGIFGRKLFSLLFDRLIAKVPVVGWVYHTSKEIAKVALDQKESPFKQTVLVPFLNPNAFYLGFPVGTAPERLRTFCPEAELVVFIPNAPYPVSGMLLFYPRALAHPVGATVGSAFKFFISGGTSELNKAQI